MPSERAPNLANDTSSNVLKMTGVAVVVNVVHITDLVVVVNVVK